jgi:hypothetical protein
LIDCYRPGDQWEHEDASIMLMEHIIDTNNIDIEREDVKIVGSLIKGEQPKDPNHEKRNIII